MKRMNPVLLAMVAVIAMLSFPGCYTQIAMRDESPRYEDYADYSETYNDSNGTVIVNNYYDSPRYRAYFDFYYPAQWYRYRHAQWRIHPHSHGHPLREHHPRRQYALLGLRNLPDAHARRQQHALHRGTGFDHQSAFALDHRERQQRTRKREQHAVAQQFAGRHLHGPEPQPQRIERSRQRTARACDHTRAPQ